MLGGCARAVELSPGSPVSADPSVSNTAFVARAKEVVQTWQRADMPKTWRLGFVPLSSERVIALGDLGFTGESKQAFMAGYFTMHAGLPLPPPPGQVIFPDGARMTVRLLTAEAALADIDRPNTSACSHPCTPFEIIDIRLGTVKVLTTRGNASTPAWMFTIAGLKAPIAYMAVADNDVSDIPAAPAADYPALEGLVGAENLISVDGATVAFALGVGACDTDIRPLVYETSDTVALGGSVATPRGLCEAILKLAPVTVVLAKPVGNRALINGLNGRPLTVMPGR
jgi:hypothetical protein